MKTSPVQIISQAVSPLSLTPSAAATGEAANGNSNRANPIEQRELQSYSLFHYLRPLFNIRPIINRFYSDFNR